MSATTEQEKHVVCDYSCSCGMNDVAKKLMTHLRFCMTVNLNFF
jgi:hypothetical protein